jgi:chaperone modulatory protein CbpM
VERCTADRGATDRGAADQGEAGWDFREIDVARVRLIHDLHRAMAIDEATMPLVLSLLDQVYALRGTLRDLLRGLETQPEPVRTTVLAALRRG